MITTLTPNPSVDLTIALDDTLEHGAVMRALSTASDPGGKGVNISRAALAAGVASTAILPARADDAFVLDLRTLGVDCRPVGGDRPVRTNVTLTEPDGTTTKINSPGSPVDATLLAELREALVRHAPRDGWTVLAGSLPPGAPAGWYVDLVAALDATGTRVAVDTSDEPLAALVAALGPAVRPSLMKPNAEELASFTGGDPDAIEADPALAAAAAATLVEAGAHAVLATLGGQGAVLVSGAGAAGVRAWHASPPPTTVVSTVGAGDSSLFGYLLGDLRGLDPAHRLALAVAYGSAAAGLPGTTIPHPEQVRDDLVAVRELDITRGAA